MTDDEIKVALSRLLASANHCKDKVLGRIVLVGIVVGLIVAALAFGFLDETLGLWTGPSFVIAVVIGFLALGLIGTLGDLVVNRRLARIAEQFRETFTEESGDYARAVEILKTAKTSEKVEIDLLKVLADEVEFTGGSKFFGLVKPKDPAKGGGLPGGFGGDGPKPGKATSPPAGDGVIPLDPLDPAGSAR